MADDDGGKKPKKPKLAKTSPYRMARTIPYIWQVKVEIAAGIDGCSQNAIVVEALKQFFNKHSERDFIDAGCERRFAPKGPRRQKDKGDAEE
jgi:hypothetical protein